MKYSRRTSGESKGANPSQHSWGSLGTFYGAAVYTNDPNRKEYSINQKVVYHNAWTHLGVASESIALTIKDLERAVRELMD